MTPTVVCDASALVALLIDSGPDGQWAAEAMSASSLSAPSLALFEASNIIRRHELSGAITSDQAAQAHADLLDLDIEQWPYGLIANRVWELRVNLSSYDASYVAVAEAIDAPLITLDRRISRAPRITCRVLTP
jgi:predicted nucleic acid-binding protein